MLDVPVLSKWFEMAKDDEVVVDAKRINHEANSNVWNFSPREDEMEGITPETLAQFVEAVMEARREWLLSRSISTASMLFYCWHEFQDRQFRFSLVSASHGKLPFGCQTEETGDLRRVTTDAVEVDWRNGSYYSVEGMEEDELESAEEEVFVLPVFVSRLP